MIVSMALALGGVARMRTRDLYAAIGNRKTREEWKQKMRLTPEAVRELEFWIKYFDRFHGQPIIDNRGEIAVDLTAFSDAGADGFGGWVKLGEGVTWKKGRQIVNRAQALSVEASMKGEMGRLMQTGLEFRGEFKGGQKEESSTWREAWGLLKLLEFTGDVMEGCTTRVFVDSQCLAFGLGGLIPGFEEGVYGGSRTREVQRVIVQIVEKCVEHRITLHAQWIPREMNERADYLSKITTHYDFSLSQWLFKQLDDRWGPHTVDRFSTAASVMVKSGRYNSRFWQQGMVGAQAVDAFLQDWRGENNWLHPPYKLVGRVVLQLRRQRSVGTVVVPQWTKASWWPLVCPGGEWAGDVVGVQALGNAVGYWRGERVEGALIPPDGEDLSQIPKGKLWALRIDCARISVSQSGMIPKGGLGWGPPTDA
jgi:hypothetical protein